MCCLMQLYDSTGRYTAISSSIHRAQASRWAAVKFVFVEVNVAALGSAL